MIALWIVLGLIVLIWLLLATPLRIFLTFADNELSYRVKYGALTIFDSDKQEKETESKPPPQSSKKKAPEKSGTVGRLLNFLGLSEISSVANVKHSISANGVVGTIRAALDAVRSLFRRIFRLIRKGVFKKFDLKIAVGDADAADAALRYGQICALIFPMMTFLENTMCFKNRSIDICCDDTLEETQISFNGQLNYRPWHFVCFAAGLFWNYIKTTSKKENKHE